MARLRTLLVLGRVSNLPTVWSNCLAGWWLGGGRSMDEFSPLLLVGITLLYVGGMFLNDAFDVEFDQQHRKERPIPSGTISLSAVWRWGFALLGAGALCLIALGTRTGALGLALVVCILVYDAVHKLITFSPVLMGLCRFLVYVVAASIAREGITGWALWCGLALAMYVMGLSFLARVESARGPLRLWPLFFLGAPPLLGIIMNTNGYRETAVLLSALLALWLVRCLRPLFKQADRQIGRRVAQLLAGIVLVDWLAVADAPREVGFVFIALFAAALLFQRFVPAT